MKHRELKLTTGVTTALGGAVGFGAAILAGPAAAAGIATSPHDFTSLGGAQISTSTEICVYCHTPHGSDTSVDAVPLWNKKLNTTNGYTRYSALGTATLDGNEAPVGSVTLACLSCHDGTQAMDTVLNAPGSGNYNSNGQLIGPNQKMTNTLGSPIPNLSQDLRDDHPVSIQYAGGSCQNTSADCTPTDATGDGDFNVAQYQAINGVDFWWVDTAGGTANQRDKTDMILYTRSDFAAPATGTGPSVECGSCHDPHNGDTAVVGASPAFMRIPNTNSQVCLACHDK